MGKLLGKTSLPAIFQDETSQLWVEMKLASCEWKTIC